MVTMMDVAVCFLVVEYICLDIYLYPIKSTSYVCF
jgi:hypothetical protein